MTWGEVQKEWLIDNGEVGELTVTDLVKLARSMLILTHQCWGHRCEFVRRYLNTLRWTGPPAQGLNETFPKATCGCCCCSSKSERVPFVSSPSFLEPVESWEIAVSSLFFFMLVIWRGALDLVVRPPNIATLLPLGRCSEKSCPGRWWCHYRTGLFWTS